MSIIDYVIISSDDNPDYADFYPIVSKRWYDLGYKTYYVNITDKDEIIETKRGIIHKIKKLPYVSTGFQAQTSRLFASNLMPDCNILTSDIDMLPINKLYYEQYTRELTSDNVVLYSGQPYKDIPYFPMCYVLTNTRTMSKYLDIEGLNFLEFCCKIFKMVGVKWTSDEHFMHNQFMNHKDKLILKSRNYDKNRIDRTSWRYDTKFFTFGYYIDAHMPVPYIQYKSHIDQLNEHIKHIC